MGGFSNGDLVWGPSKKAGETMWPAVVVQAIDHDDHAKCLIRFIRAEHRHLEDISNSKEFRLDRSSLHLFDPISATKYEPESTTDYPSLKRNQFNKVVQLATKLFEERKQKVQEEYRRAVERATRRASDIVASEDAEPTAEIAAGAHLFFWIPGMIAGKPEAEMYARVLTVYDPSRYAESKIPLELDSGHVLTMNDSVKMLKPVETKLMPLRKFKLKTSCVNGVRISDIVRQSIESQFERLKSENPAYAFMLRDHFGTTRQPKKADADKQEAQDKVPTVKRKKKPKRKKPNESDGLKQQTLKRDDLLKERSGWKPECRDSEDDEDNRLKYLPQLSVPNRAEVQSAPSCSKVQSTPIRSTRPNVSDSDSASCKDLLDRPSNSEDVRFKTSSPAYVKTKSTASSIRKGAEKNHAATDSNKKRSSLKKLRASNTPKITEFLPSNLKDVVNSDLKSPEQGYTSITVSTSPAFGKEAFTKSSPKRQKIQLAVSGDVSDDSQLSRTKDHLALVSNIRRRRGHLSAASICSASKPSLYQGCSDVIIAQNDDHWSIGA